LIRLLTALLESSLQDLWFAAEREGERERERERKRGRELLFAACFDVRAVIDTPFFHTLYR
jgi:hypothetical protein